jgi:hypothetical protein
MKGWRSIDGKSTQKAAIPSLTLETFVRAASAVNVIVGTLVFIEFSVFSLVNRSGRDLVLGIFLLPFVTLVIWSIAAAMCVLALGPKWLWSLGQRLIRGISPPRPMGSLGVWDDWLDSPPGGVVLISRSGKPAGSERNAGFDAGP